MQLTEDQKFIFGAIGLFIVLCVIALAIGGIFRACDNRQINKREANVKTAENNVANAQENVTEAKQEAAEKKGVIKVWKEVIKENNEEVNKQIKVRRQAADNTNRVIRNPLGNVNGSELHRILNEADRR